MGLEAHKRFLAAPRQAEVPTAGEGRSLGSQGLQTPPIPIPRGRRDPHSAAKLHPASPPLELLGHALGSRKGKAGPRSLPTLFKCPGAVNGDMDCWILQILPHLPEPAIIHTPCKARGWWGCREGARRRCSSLLPLGHTHARSRAHALTRTHARRTSFTGAHRSVFPPYPKHLFLQNYC